MYFSYKAPVVLSVSPTVMDTSGTNITILGKHFGLSHARCSILPLASCPPDPVVYIKSVPVTGADHLRDDGIRRTMCTLVDFTTHTRAQPQRVRVFYVMKLL